MRLRVESGTPDVQPGPASGCRSLGGRLVASVFCLIFFGVGSLFTGLVARELLRAADTYRWPAVAATILSSGVETEIPFEIARGELAVSIPDDTMHSFAGDHNKVVWVVRVSGEVPGWPDVNDEFPVEIHPLPPGGVWR
jgi:hypothetical protein